MYVTVSIVDGDAKSEYTISAENARKGWIKLSSDVDARLVKLEAGHKLLIIIHKEPNEQGWRVLQDLRVEGA